MVANSILQSMEARAADADLDSSPHRVTPSNTKKKQKTISITEKPGCGCVTCLETGLRYKMMPRRVGIRMKPRKP